MTLTRLSGKKRKSNVVILKAPEPNKYSTAEQRRNKDNESDIEVCWRAGKLDESKPDYASIFIIYLFIFIHLFIYIT